MDSLIESAMESLQLAKAALHKGFYEMATARLYQTMDYVDAATTLQRGGLLGMFKPQERALLGIMARCEAIGQQVILQSRNGSPNPLNGTAKVAETLIKELKKI
jgi:hypothetical protein